MFNNNNSSVGMNNNGNNRGNNANQRFGTSSFHSMQNNGGNRSSNGWQSGNNQTTPRSNRNNTTNNQQHNNSTVGLFTSVFTQTANIGDPSEDENQLNRQFVQSANLIAQFYTSSILAYRKSYQQGVKKSFRRLSSLLLQYSNQQQSQNAQIPINLVLTMMNQVLQEELTASNPINNNTSTTSMNTSSSEPSSTTTTNGRLSPSNNNNNREQTSPMSSLSVHNSTPSNGNSPQANKNDDIMPSSPVINNSAGLMNSDHSLIASTTMECSNHCSTTSNESQQSTESNNLPHSSTNSLNIHYTASNTNNSNNHCVNNGQEVSIETTNHLHSTIQPHNSFAFPFQFTPPSNLSGANPSNSPFDFSSIPTDYSFANALLSGGVTTTQLSSPYGSNINHPSNNGSTNTRSSNHHHHHHHKGSSHQQHQRSFYNGSFTHNPLKRDIRMLNIPNNCDEDDEDEAPTFLFRSIHTTTNSGSTTCNNNPMNQQTNNSFLTENSSNMSPTPFSEHAIPPSSQNTGDFSELSPLTQIFKKNRI